jgi:hypothetical protein
MDEFFKKESQDWSRVQKDLLTEGSARIKLTRHTNNVLKKKKVVSGFNQLYSLSQMAVIYDYYAGYTGPLYFSYTLDFRGRVYYDSSLSPQGQSIARFMYYYGAYTPEEEANLERVYRLYDVELSQIEAFMPILNDVFALNGLERLTRPQRHSIM